MTAWNGAEGTGGSAPAAPTPPVTDALLAAVDRGVRILDLAQPLSETTPCSPNAPGFRRTLLRRHGDAWLADEVSFATDLLITGTHVGTHVDAVAHISHRGQLHGGHDAREAQTGGGFTTHDARAISPMVCRGVLLDVAALHGVDCLPAGYGITRDDLRAAAESAGVRLNPGDVALVRSGWGAHIDDARAFVGLDTGVPGVTEDAALWLAERQVRATGGETIAYERIEPGAGHSTMPVHRILLVEHAIPIIEVMALQPLHAAAVRSFLFVMAPLPLAGATGSPVRPLAVIEEPVTGPAGA